MNGASRLAYFFHIITCFNVILNCLMNFYFTMSPVGNNVTDIKWCYRCVLSVFVKQTLKSKV